MAGRYHCDRPVPGDIRRHRRLALQGLLLCVVVLSAWRSPASSLAAGDAEHVSFLRDGRPAHLLGQVLVEADDGGLLLKDAEGVLWAIQPNELTDRRSVGKPLEPLPRDVLSERLQRRFSDSFRVHHTAHYVICYNTTEAYAEWVGALFERLYAAFHTYWGRQGVELHPPRQPLVALVFQDSNSYAEYARAELGEATSSIVGYYSLQSNRVTMYDLTRADRLGAFRPTTTAAHINLVLSRPDAERTVATIIHEATHQLAFNCGLHERYADIPVWVSEGIAVYFETPDLRSSRGWRRIGAVNEARLAQFRRYLRSRPDDSLRTLLADDTRFRESRTAVDAYAEAWVLNYYLLHKHSEEYAEYLKTLSQKTPLIYDTPRERIALLESKLGISLRRLDEELLRYTARLQ